MRLIQTRMSRRARNQIGAGAAAAEFAPALLIFFLIILFPFINLIMFATGAATAYLAAKQCASRAATQSTFTEALNVVETESNWFVSSGFGQFAKLVPQGGYNACGVDLNVIQTSTASPYAVTKGGMNTPWGTQITQTQLNTNTYEYRVQATYNVGPFMDLSSVPYLGGVPGLGIPATLTFTALGAAEFPEGLNQ